jgi:hypothetical protein
MLRHALFVLTVAALAACNDSPKNTAGGPDTGLALARTSRAKDSLIMVKDSLLGEKEKQLSAQSQLIGDAATSARLVSEIDRDLSKVRSLRIKPDTTQRESAMLNASEQLATVQKKVNALVARLNSSEARLRRMRKDSATHATFDASQLVQMQEYERSIGDLRASVEQQRTEIAGLTARLDSMGRSNVALAARNDTITARVNALAAHEDSMFVAIGTEKELTSKGLIHREGGTLLLFGRGKTIVPSRALDPAAFTVVSKTNSKSIPLPRADKEYRVVSRQSLEFTSLADTKEPKVRGTLEITDPDKFWAPSRYLILVQR